MTTRSTKAAQRTGFSSLASQSNSSPRRGRKRRISPTDLEEELANPKRSDYNLLRKTLIATRSVSESRSIELEKREIELEKWKRELRARDSALKSQDAELEMCSKLHLDQIHQLREKVKKLEQKEEEMRTKGESVEPVPVEQARKENKEATPIGNAMVEKLRSAIHEFAATYFGSKLQHPLTAVIGAGWAEQFMQDTTPGENTYVDYLLSRQRCPMIIEAFIWRFLCGTIFDCASWGGSEEIRRHVSELQKILGEYR